MSPHDYADHQSESVADAVTAMKLESDAAPENSAMPNGGGAMIKDESSNAASNASPVPTPKAERSRSSSRAPVKKEENYEDDGGNSKGAENNHGDNVEEKVGGDIIVKLEPGQPPKLTRSSSQKVVPRPPQLFAHLPDSTAEAQATFDLMDACTYANKYMGYTEHAMECDCAEEWGKFLLRYLLRCLSTQPRRHWLHRLAPTRGGVPQTHLEGGWERPLGLRSCLFVSFLYLSYLFKHSIISRCYFDTSPPFPWLLVFHLCVVLFCASSPHLRT